MTHFDDGSKRRSYRFSYLLTLVTLILLSVVYKPISQFFEALGIPIQSGGITGSFLVFFLSLGLILTLYRLIFRVFPIITRPGLKVYVLISLLFLLFTGFYEYRSTHRTVEAAVFNGKHAFLEASFRVDHAEIIQPESSPNKAYALLVTPGTGLHLSTYTKGWFGWNTSFATIVYPPAEDSSSPSVFSKTDKYSSLVLGIYRSLEPFQVQVNGQPVHTIHYQQLKPYVSEDLYIWYYEYPPGMLENMDKVHLTAHDVNGIMVDRLDL
ncbi:hypothetical protein PAEVO_27010 [Paenibacillus sp. GM2FR]|uniref:hypothetical protein n=1 Tax=unclassified Paenibacillus TaxID=185978 RepID=UPI000C27EF57|nr:hypothetical protein [Paenibacillus sp. GM2FR]PJN55978.1 hypothetical protein PAEVO_27010 [Paenibacillus sp. GM2FR]